MSCVASCAPVINLCVLVAGHWSVPGKAEGRQLHQEYGVCIPCSSERSRKMKELSLENEATVEMVCLLVLRNPTAHINMDVDVDEMVQKRLFTESCWLPQDSAKNQAM